MDCRHLHPGKGFYCDAFPAPGRIPDAILTNEHYHREPFPGDHGIRFEQKPADPSGSDSES